MTYTIHRYPAELIDIVQLSGGKRITLRPILPQDADLMQTFVRTLSPESRHNRFFRTLHELPSDLLDRFTNVDYHRHLALLAEVFVDGTEVIVGEARFVVEDDPTQAEFAITVADGWQGQGIGRLLLERLEERARAEGLAVLFAQTLPGNVAMQSLARGTGFRIGWDLEAGGVLRLEKDLHLKASATACTGTCPAALAGRCPAARSGADVGSRDSSGWAHHRPC